MSTFIKLKNNRTDLKGSDLYFNIDHIVCIYDSETPENFKTFIFAGSPPQTWDVEESSIEVMRKIRDAQFYQKEV
tara:strand:+ start:872 stop:1096 length:225 start_codon:yes stop_codon:yes gene_type:complete